MLENDGIDGTQVDEFGEIKPAASTADTAIAKVREAKEVRAAEKEAKARAREERRAERDEREAEKARNDRVTGRAQVGPLGGNPV